MLYGIYAQAQSWTADNGNGTFTNPIFYEEFSDPDIIRVGSEFYMVGSSMHTMPGLPLLRSSDLVNWEFVCRVFDELDFGPEYHLEGDTGAYGNGIWAPAIRYHEGVFYVFVNVNNYGLQVFSTTDPTKEWKHTSMGGRIYDLGILFDEDKIYAVHGYDEVRLIEIKPDFSGYVEGSDRVIIPKGNAMGEGHHFYKIEGKYYIISADFAPVGRMQCARADDIEGPYETAVISHRETMGIQRGWWTPDFGFWNKIPEEGDEIRLQQHGGNAFGAVPLHQGGIVDLPYGERWGFSMMDVKSAGRMTFLSPVTWQDGWPFFGVKGNLGRSPRTWFKPNTENQSKPMQTFKRSDDFSADLLQPIWQWNHLPVHEKWSLTENRGALRLHTLPAKNLLLTRNSLTQRVVGPQSSATVELSVDGMLPGDIAGLAFLNIPYYWVGVVNDRHGMHIRCYDQVKNKSNDIPFDGGKIWLRLSGDYDQDMGTISYSTDGVSYSNLADGLILGYQMKTFQGVRYALFAYNTNDQEGGFADFKNFRVDEPLADRTNNLPLGRRIRINNVANDLPAYASPKGMFHFARQPPKNQEDHKAFEFVVHDRGRGVVVLEAGDGSGYVSVVGAGLSGDVRILKEASAASQFLWQDMLFGNQFMLLSLKNNRYVGLNPITDEPYSADWPGTQPDRKDGVALCWEEIGD